MLSMVEHEGKYHQEFFFYRNNHELFQFFFLTHTEKWLADTWLKVTWHKISSLLLKSIKHHRNTKLVFWSVLFILNTSSNMFYAVPHEQTLFLECSSQAEISIICVLHSNEDQLCTYLLHWCFSHYQSGVIY